MQAPFRDTLSKPEPLYCHRCGDGLTIHDAEGCDDCGVVLCRDCALEHDKDGCD